MEIPSLTSVWISALAAASHLSKLLPNGSIAYIPCIIKHDVPYELLLLYSNHIMITEKIETSRTSGKEKIPSSVNYSLPVQPTPSASHVPSFLGQAFTSI
jgi:hypothetical protein